MTATLRVPRSRGALSGLLLMLLGLWGTLLPLIGPYFDFGFAPDKAWHFTSGRVWLQIVPGIAVFVGGLITLGSSNRAFAAFGAWLAALGGAWFVVGVPLSALWAAEGHTQLGQALGDTTRRVSEQLTLLYGLGVVAVFLSSVALGRLAVVAVKDAELAEEAHEQTVRDEDASPAHGLRPDGVPAMPPEPMTPRTSAPGDLKVAGEPDTEEIRYTPRPGANA